MSWIEGGNTVQVDVAANQIVTGFVMSAMVSSWPSTDDYKPEMVEKILRAKAQRPIGRFNKDEFILWLDKLVAE